ncbi:mitochondrial amidoxime-reducing component 1 isoform X1 [Tamandua tetradactyla]
MVTARQEPRLVLISLTCDGDSLILSAAYTKDLLLPIKTPTANAVLKCRVHGLEIEGRDCGDTAAQWITSFLKTQPCRLVHFEPHMRPRSSQQIMDAFRPADQIAYPDASPFLILSEASLADLNSRLEKKVKATNFRPNIIISGCGAYAEDSWNELLIGDVELKRVIACTRCILTMVDPDTGVMSRKEPLETLKSKLLGIRRPLPLDLESLCACGNGLRAPACVWACALRFQPLLQLEVFIEGGKLTPNPERGQRGAGSVELGPLLVSCRLVKPPKPHPIPPALIASNTLGAGADSLRCLLRSLTEISIAIDAGIYVLPRTGGHKSGKRKARPHPINHGQQNQWQQQLLGRMLGAPLLSVFPSACGVQGLLLLLESKFSVVTPLVSQPRRQSPG